MTQVPTDEPTHEEEMLLMYFWALSVDIARLIPPERRQLVAGLEEALVAVSRLPAEIGWGEAPQPTEITQKSNKAFSFEIWEASYPPSRPRSQAC